VQLLLVALQVSFLAQSESDLHLSAHTFVESRQIRCVPCIPPLHSTSLEQLSPIPLRFTQRETALSHVDPVLQSESKRHPIMQMSSSEEHTLPVPLFPALQSVSLSQSDPSDEVAMLHLPMEPLEELQVPLGQSAFFRQPSAHFPPLQTTPSPVALLLQSASTRHAPPVPGILTEASGVEPPEVPPGQPDSRLESTFVTETLRCSPHPASSLLPNKYPKMKGLASRIGK
jgi:hypothetical protein